MTESTISFPAEIMQQIVTKAIIDGLGEGTRDMLIQQAVTALVTPQKTNSWDRPGTTPIQDAFAQAARNVINQVAREVIEEDPVFLAKARELITEAMTEALVTDHGYSPLRSKIIEAVAGVLINATVRD